MEGNRRHFLNKRSQPQFKRTGGPSKRREHDSVREEYSEKCHSSETVYRILCKSKKIGSVIGKGGNIVKALREETQAKITVSDSVPGSDERVITIFSPSDKAAKIRRTSNRERVEKRNAAMEPHCAAQDALLRVHDRIVEEDLHESEKRNRDETVIIARLLVSNNTVGCILGKKGDVIQRLRSETGANIRILPADHLPACAMSSDELVQISGEASIAKKALYEISTLLHQNPRKDAPPLHPIPYSSQKANLPGSAPPLRNELPPGNLAWLEHTADAYRMQFQPMPLKGDYGAHPAPFGPEDFDCFTPPREREAPSEFTLKIICSADKIGGVIGKGGSNVRQLEQDTGASIHVENVPRESYGKVIRVSSFELRCDQRSPTIDAILHLQDKTSEFSDNGTIITRLLVLASKVGCILGQGGHIINDLRRRTHADIRVFSKEDKPKCALEDEELVQICGSYGVARDALVEIASRLRARCLRDADARGEPTSVRPLPVYDPAENLRGGSYPLSGTVRAGSSGRYEYLQGSVRDFEPPSFPVPPLGASYLDVNEAKIGSVSSTGGGHRCEFTRPRMSARDPYIMGPDFGTREQFNSPHPYLPAAASSPPIIYQRPDAYHRYDSQQGAYQTNTASPVPYQSPKPNSRLAMPSYQNVYTQHGSYQSMRAHDSYRY